MIVKKLKFLLVLCISIVFIQCSDNPASPNKGISRELTIAEQRLVESDNKFGFNLFKKIIEEEKDKNVFISPLSISMALGMTLNGADGSTREAMQATLEFQGLTMQEVNESYKSLIELLTQLDPKVIFQIANSIWYRQEVTFEEEFLNTNKTYFDAIVQALDFNNPDVAADIINSWVKENTNDRIEKIIEGGDIDQNTVMFLINAIYFKGTWTYEFDKDLTQDDLFTLPDGSQKPIKMMIQENDSQYFENADFQAIDLPYGDGNFSMTILLPHPQKDIDFLIAEFNQNNWDQWISSFSEKPGTLHLPRFTLEYELTLNDVLKALGMEIAFDPNQADFTKMYKGSERLFISEVKHKTFVEVNEEGTEAAAVTSVEVGATSAGGSEFTMRVDRPFVFVIRENHSQTILFMGKIVEPIL